MIGGVFLCFEGFKKVHQMLAPHDAHANAADAGSYKVDASAVEEEKVAGAIRTDFILSAEIMAISLASITSPDILTQAIVKYDWRYTTHPLRPTAYVAISRASSISLFNLLNRFYWSSRVSGL